jgi:hypothetical protein
MSDLLHLLGPQERRGSKPRCHSLTHGSANEIAARLSDLAAPFGTVSCEDRWMPQGFIDVEEAQLDKAPSLLDAGVRQSLKSWWLAPASYRARTPHFDIASTCTIEGRHGLLLVEAKAHDKELVASGKPLDLRRLNSKSAENRRASHKKIGAAIAAASNRLERATSLPWKITRDSHYQMSNRFAWAWKLTDLGIPVVLVYLGFLGATEMADLGTPFANHADWERLVVAHSEPLLPSQVWGRRWESKGHPFVPLIKSVECQLHTVSKGGA